MNYFKSIQKISSVSHSHKKQGEKGMYMHAHVREVFFECSGSLSAQ